MALRGEYLIKLDTTTVCDVCGVPDIVKRSILRLARKQYIFSE